MHNRLIQLEGASESLCSKEVAAISLCVREMFLFLRDRRNLTLCKGISLKQLNCLRLLEGVVVIRNLSVDSSI